MAEILTTENRTDWKSEVRTKLIGGDDTNILPDATVTLFVSLAERNIKKKCSIYATILTGGGDDKEFLIDATVSMLCALLVPSVRNLQAISYIMGDLSEKKDLDFDKLEADLYGEVENYLSQISTYIAVDITRTGVVSRSPVMFEAIDD